MCHFHESRGNPRVACALYPTTNFKEIPLQSLPNFDVEGGTRPTAAPKKHNSKKFVSVGDGKQEESGGGGEIGWELRPGGMLVQMRTHEVGAAGPMIKIKVSHGSYQHEINLPAKSTFGDLKRLLAHETGLEPTEQRLLFRGKEKENDECLHMVGVKDMSKVVLLEDPASKERKLQEMKKDNGISKACEAVAKVRAEVDKLAKKVSELENAVQNGTKVTEKEFNVLTELLMLQLLKLDSIEGEGEAKVQRRIEVRRVQSFVDILDISKARNSNPFSKNGTAVSVTTKWETFESGVGSLNAPSRKITKL